MLVGPLFASFQHQHNVMINIDRHVANTSITVSTISKHLSSFLHHNRLLSGRAGEPSPRNLPDTTTRHGDSDVHSRRLHPFHQHPAERRSEH